MGCVEVIDVGVRRWVTEFRDKGDVITDKTKRPWGGTIRAQLQVGDTSQSWVTNRGKFRGQCGVTHGSE